MKEVGDWFFVPYNFVDCPFVQIEEDKEVIICHDGTYYRMLVTHRRIGGISGKVLEVLGEQISEKS